MSGISESARKAAPRHRASLLVRTADDAHSHIAHLLELGELFSDRRLAQAPMQLQLVMPLPVLVDPCAAGAEELLQGAVRVTADLKPEAVAAVLEFKRDRHAAHRQAAALAHGALFSMRGRRQNAAGETAPLS